MTSIFIFNDNKLELSTPEILLIPEFKRILDKDSSSKKELAFKEFNYIYQIADYKSYCNRNGLNGDDAYNYAVNTAQLPNGYIINKDVELAIDRYRLEQENIIIKLNNEILKSFNSSYATLQIINELIIYLIEQTKKVKAEHPEDIKRIDELTSQIIRNQEKLMGISKEIPKQIETHKNYEVLLKKEEEKIKLAWGGGKIIGSMISSKYKQ